MSSDAIRFVAARLSVNFPDEGLAMDKNLFLIRLSEDVRTDFGRIAFEEQSDNQKVFSAVWAIESEVNSGGFSSFLKGGQSHTAYFAPFALRTIGASKCAVIVEKALSIGPAGDMTLLALMDSEFIRYPDNLTDLLFNFVSNHPEVFGPVPH